MEKKIGTQMRVLVCGGRDYGDWKMVYRALEDLPVAVVIEGGAPGADLIAREWATVRGIPVETYDADWETHGRAAGPLRNQRMLDDGRPDMVLAFPGGKGTQDMCRRAHAAGIKVQMMDNQR